MLLYAKFGRFTNILLMKRWCLMAKNHSQTKAGKINPLWGGRFDAGASQIMDKINVSIDFDKKLYAQDIKASLAHAEMLERQGIIASGDASAIKQGLSEIEAEIEAGTFEFIRDFEDIHMNIEQALADKIGDAAGRLHTARSRNDQVAT